VPHAQPRREFALEILDLRPQNIPPALERFRDRPVDFGFMRQVIGARIGLRDNAACSFSS